jgi:hypothetical protein
MKKKVFYNKTFIKGQQLFFKDFKRIQLEKSLNDIDQELYMMVYFFWKLRYTDRIAYRQISGLNQIVDDIDYKEQFENKLRQKIDIVYKSYKYFCFIDFVTKNDILKILSLKITIPQMNFLFNLVKYYNPRQNQQFYKDIGISQKLLAKWCSSQTYKKYLKYFEETLHIIKRSESYKKGKFCKQITFINWPKAIPKDFVHGHHQYYPITLKQILLILYPNWINLKLILKAYNYDNKSLYKIHQYIYN